MIISVCSIVVCSNKESAIVFTLQNDMFLEEWKRTLLIIATAILMIIFFPNYFYYFVLIRDSNTLPIWSCAGTFCLTDKYCQPENSYDKSCSLKWRQTISCLTVKV